MSIEKAKACLSALGYADHIIELAASTATVSEAAQTLGVQPGMIAKTMSFLQGDKAVLILTEGTAKVDNRKYKDTFRTKAKMIPFEDVERLIGHAPGGVCPFDVPDKTWTCIWTRVCGSLKPSIRRRATTTAPSS